jgi:hypothetical protein
LDRGLPRDKTRPGRAPLERKIIERVVALTAQAPPGEVTYWTAGMMAKAARSSVCSAQRIFRGAQWWQISPFRRPNFGTAAAPPCRQSSRSA